LCGPLALTELLVLFSLAHRSRLGKWVHTINLQAAYPVIDVVFCGKFELRNLSYCY